MEQAAILVVDDDREVRGALAQALAALGYRTLTADSAEVALALVEESPPDVVLSDVRMGAMSGIELCARLKAHPRFVFTPVILLTAAADRGARVAGLAAGADDFFSKPCDLVELRTRVGALVRMKSLLDQLERAESVIATLALTIEARDPHTAGHCERLARYAVAVGRAMGLDDGMLRALRLGGFLHDLGKIAIPDGILMKPGPLDRAEREVIRAHPVVGADLVKGLRTLERSRPIIRHHHERWDGAGYPDGLRGEAIPLGARIMAVVDVYDALRSARPHKGPLPHEAGVAVLLRETDAGQWDPRITPTFLEVLQDLGADTPRRSPPRAGRPARASW